MLWLIVELKLDEFVEVMACLIRWLVLLDELVEVLVDLSMCWLICRCVGSYFFGTDVTN